MRVGVARAVNHRIQRTPLAPMRAEVATEAETADVGMCEYIGTRTTERA